jgi:hypothetical protein
MFKHMVDLFATNDAVPLWDSGEPWYIGLLTQPYTPGPDFWNLGAGEFGPDESDAHFVVTLPAGFEVGYVPGTNRLRVKAPPDDAATINAIVNTAGTIGQTVYGFYLYYAAVLDESWAATAPLDVPQGPLVADEMIEFPQVEFTFDPVFQF